MPANLPCIEAGQAHLPPGPLDLRDGGPQGDARRRLKEGIAGKAALMVDLSRV